jgi:hypothetical protein
VQAFQRDIREARIVVVCHPANERLVSPRACGAQVVKNLVRKWCTAASSAPDGGQVDALKDFYAYTFDVCADWLDGRVHAGSP